MDDSWLTHFVGTHPIAAYFGWVVTFAVLFLVTGLIAGTFRGWPIFVILGVFLPVAVISKERRRSRNAR